MSYHHGDLRRALMDEMAALVDEQGVQAASLRVAARRLGVSEAAPYHHFRSKTDLLGAIAFEGYAAQLEAMKAAVYAAGDDPFERIGAMGRAYIRFALQNRGRFRVMFGEQMLEVANSVSPEVLAMGREAATWPVSIAAGACPDHALAVHRVLWSLVHGAATLLLEQEIRLAPDEIDRFVDDVADAGMAMARGFRAAKA